MNYRDTISLASDSAYSLEDNQYIYLVALYFDYDNLTLTKKLFIVKTH